MNSSDFELRLGSQLRELAQLSVTPIDPLATAQAVVGQPRGLRLPWRISLPSHAARLAWIAALVGLLAVGLLTFAYVGSRNARPSPTPAPSPSLSAVVAPPSPSPSAAAATVEQLAVISQGDLYLGTTDGFLTPTGARAAIDGDSLGPSTADLKAARWAPDGSRLVVAIGQQPGDPLWKGMGLVDQHGAVLSWVRPAADFTWGYDSQHLVLVPFNPGSGSAFYSGLDYFTDSGTHAPNMAGATSLGITRPGLPLGPAFLSGNLAVTALEDIEIQGNGYAPDPAGTDSVWVSDLGASGPAQNPLTTHSALAAAISPHAVLVAFVDRTSLTVAQLDGSSSCTIELADGAGTGGEDPLLPSVAWSPDGGRIAVLLTNYGQSGLWTVAPDCSASTLLTSGTYTFGATYGDDAVGDGSTPLKVASGEFLNGRLDWSHDGRFVYYTSLAATDATGSAAFPDLSLRRISADGGQSVVIVPDVEDFDVFVP